VAVTEGLLKLMNRDELEGVLAHELAHVTNRDILIGSIAATMAGAIMIPGQYGSMDCVHGGGSSSDNQAGEGVWERSA